MGKIERIEWCQTPSEDEWFHPPSEKKKDYNPWFQLTEEERESIIGKLGKAFNGDTTLAMIPGFVVVDLDTNEIIGKKFYRERDRRKAYLDMLAHEEEEIARRSRNRNRQSKNN